MCLEIYDLASSGELIVKDVFFSKLCYLKILSITKPAQKWKWILQNPLCTLFLLRKH